jgi:uncharacterized coiled-coil protein SlyX
MEARLRAIEQRLFHLEIRAAEEPEVILLSRRLTYLERVMSMVESLLDVLFHEGWFHSDRNHPCSSVGR